MGKLKLKNQKTKKDKFYSHIEITAALIVKNEEDNIRRCLNSIRWCDAIVVVDTGSTDRTKEIIRSEYPNVELYEDEWDNNFSRSRNVSLSYVKTNWTLIIDADEEWVFEEGSTPDSLKAELLKLPVNKVGCVKMLLEDMVQGQVAATFKPTRLFNGKSHLKYKSTVHNEPVFKGQAAVCGGIKLLHYGYDVPTEKAKMKVDRTAGLLQARLEKNPKDYEAMFYLTNIYSAYVSYARLEKTMEWAEVYFQHLPEMDPGKVRRNIFYSAAETARRLGDINACGRWIAEGMKRYPKDLDLNYARLLYGINAQDPQSIIEGASAYIRQYEAMERDPLVQSAGFVFTKKPMNLMNAFHKLGLMRMQEGIEFLKRVDRLALSMPLNVRLDITTSLSKELEMIGCESLKPIFQSNKVVPNLP